MAWSCWSYNSFEHADRAAGTCGDDNHLRPSEEILFFLGAVGFVLMPLPLLGHPRRCRPQAVALPGPRSSLHKIFSRDRVSSNSENYAISAEILRGPGGANPHRSRAGAQAAQPEDSNKMD